MTKKLPLLFALAFGTLSALSWIWGFRQPELQSATPGVDSASGGFFLSAVLMGPGLAIYLPISFIYIWLFQHQFVGVLPAVCWKGLMIASGLFGWGCVGFCLGKLFGRG